MHRAVAYEYTAKRHPFDPLTHGHVVIQSVKNEQLAALTDRNDANGRKVEPGQRLHHLSKLWLAPDYPRRVEMGSDAPANASPESKYISRYANNFVQSLENIPDASELASATFESLDNLMAFLADAFHQFLTPLLSAPGAFTQNADGRCVPTELGRAYIVKAGEEFKAFLPKILKLPARELLNPAPVAQAAPPPPAPVAGNTVQNFEVQPSPSSPPQPASAAMGSQPPSSAPLGDGTPDIGDPDIGFLNEQYDPEDVEDVRTDAPPPDSPRTAMQQEDDARIRQKRQEEKPKGDDVG